MIPSDGSPLGEAVAALVERARERFHADLETACEAAVQGGEHGVSVRWKGMTYTIAVDPDVPYGVINEHLG